jgi:hypothetical protein
LSIFCLQFTLEQSKQPEGYIRPLLPSVINATTDVLKTYPNHEGMKGYKAKAETVQKKVDPNCLEAPPKDDFKVIWGRSLVVYFDCLLNLHPPIPDSNCSTGACTRTKPDTDTQASLAELLPTETLRSQNPMPATPSLSLAVLRALWILGQRMSRLGSRYVFVLFFCVLLC